MIRRCLFVLLLIISSASNAQNWQRITSTDDAVLYVDSRSIKKNGNTRRAWVLIDFTKRLESTGAMSMIVLNEFHCTEDKRRLMSFNQYSDRMGSGNVLEPSSRVTDWSYTAPGTVEETILRYVCR